MIFDTVTGHGDIHEQPLEEIAYALSGPGDRHKRLRPEMPVQQDDCRPERRSGFRRCSQHRRGRAWQPKCSGRLHAGAVLVEGQQDRCKAIGAEPGHRIPDHSDRRSVPRLTSRSLAPIFDNRKPDATEENIQARIRGNYLMALSNKFGSMVSEHGKQIRKRSGLLYAVRRHGRRTCGDFRCAENDGL